LRHEHVGPDAARLARPQAQGAEGERRRRPYPGGGQDGDRRTQAPDPRPRRASKHHGHGRRHRRGRARIAATSCDKPRRSNRRYIGRTTMRIHLAKLAATLALATALPAAAWAQAPVQRWPQRSIKMIVPFPAGGGTDFIARLAAKHLSERLGQQVFVENRAGANGAIGLQALMQSDADGYTISTCSDTPLVVNPSLYEKLPYAPLRAFVPVATLVRFPGMLAVHPSVPARSVSQLIVLAKSKPAALAYASAGVGNF